MARPFYVIGHNPNSVRRAIRCLEEGANALEPDVCWERGAFYVHEKIPLVPGWLLRLFRRSLTLAAYLRGLGEYLKEHQCGARLALIAFDLKPPYTYDLSTLESVIHDGFSSDFPHVAILTTASDRTAATWLGRFVRRIRRRAVGVDEHWSASEANDGLMPGPLDYTYANGTSFPLCPTTRYLADVRDAVALRAGGSARGFSLIYAWTVNAESSMTAFLDGDVDGLITDAIPRLRALLAERYATKYVLATAHDDPFP
jgi:hypothetical protein